MYVYCLRIKKKIDKWNVRKQVILVNSPVPQTAISPRVFKNFKTYLREKDFLWYIDEEENKMKNLFACPIPRGNDV
ncbi:UNVERIFIED_CONTAM: hypothetical protein NCL1_13895 [Trichonephila clavipes]